MMIVFDNLINNAFKYANQRISIVYKQEKIIISNDGSKIENKDINHILNLSIKQMYPEMIPILQEWD